MKKKSMNILLAIIILSFVGYLVTSRESSNSKELKAEANHDLSKSLGNDIGQIHMTYDEINTLLANSSKAKDNVLVKMLGLSEVTRNIEEESLKAISKSDDVDKLIRDCEDKDKLESYNKDIKSWREKFIHKSDIIKAAKQQKDVNSLSAELSNMLKLIKDYNIYLSEVVEELK